MSKKFNITEAEWPIMRVLWEKEAANAAEIVRAVTRERDVSMRTIKTLIRRLITKNMITFTVDPNDARIYHYKALISEDEGIKSKNQNLLNLVYENNTWKLMTHFLKQNRLTPEEIDKLQELLRKKQEEINNE